MLLVPDGPKDPNEISFRSPPKFRQSVELFEDTQIFPKN